MRSFLIFNPNFPGQPYHILNALYFSKPWGNTEGEEWGKSRIDSCWPYIAAQVIPYDANAPIRLQCRVHAKNIETQIDEIKNYRML